jgi:hypothetical protein
MHALRYRDQVEWFGRPSAGYAFRIDKKRYVMKGTDVKLHRFLQKLEVFLGRTASPCSLLSFRGDFRAILADEPIPEMLWCVVFGKGLSRRIATWLLGRVRYHRGVAVLATHCQYEADPALRRQVAKAFLRLEAWSQLRDMAALDRDPIVRRIAASASRPPAAFQGRLSRFLNEDVKASAVPAGPRRERPTFFVNATPGVGLPPKSPWFIRMILERIRRLVHGSSEEGDPWFGPRAKQ